MGSALIDVVGKAEDPVGTTATFITKLRAALETTAEGGSIDYPHNIDVKSDQETRPHEDR